LLESFSVEVARRRCGGLVALFPKPPSRVCAMLYLSVMLLVSCIAYKALLVEGVQLSTGRNTANGKLELKDNKESPFERKFKLNTTSDNTTDNKENPFELKFKLKTTSDDTTSQDGDTTSNGEAENTTSNNSEDEHKGKNEGDGATKSLWVIFLFLALICISGIVVAINYRPQEQ